MKKTIVILTITLFVCTAMLMACAGGGEQALKDMQTYGALKKAVPSMIDTVKSRVDVLAASKKLPAGLNAKKLADAKADLAAATDGWKKAEEAQKAKKVGEAVTLGKAAKASIEKAMGTLGIPIPVPAPEKKK